MMGTIQLDKRKKLFPDNIAGTSKKDGIGFPDFIKIGKAFNINSYQIDNLEDLNTIFNKKHLIIMTQ